VEYKGKCEEVERCQAEIKELRATAAELTIHN
jgi:hypothetical protein